MRSNIIKKVSNKVSNYIFYVKYSKNNQEFQWKTKAEIRCVQTEKLKKILKTTIETVPFYKNLNINVDFENFTLDELNKFPVVNKQVIRENFKDFCSTEYDGKLSHTSGSTGDPFEFKITDESDVFEDLVKFRAWGMGKDYFYKKGDPVIVLRSYSPKENEPLFKVSKSNNYWFLSPFHINDKSLNTYIDFMKKSNAKIIRGYPSSIYIFTLLLKEKNIKLPHIVTLITSSETLLPIYREVIEDYWQLPVLDWYGQNERTVTVQQCWAGNYHNNDDYGIVEIDEQNNIVATSLNNLTMPFIRYNTNDKAIPLEKPIDICPCGRHLSIPFKCIEGRSDDILIKDDGTPIPTANFSTAMKNFNELKQFQIIQNENRSVVLKLVISKKDSNYIELIAKEVYQRLGKVNLKIEILSEIERNCKTGKIKVTVQKGRIK